jgi:hypothetical protein
MVRTRNHLSWALPLVMLAACAESNIAAPVASIAHAIVGYTAPTQWGYTPAALVRLQDGRVLVASGVTAEIYDPVAETWSSAGMMSAYRYWHALAVLPDGRVLAAGGAGSAGASADVLDPLTGTWTQTGALTRPRGNAAAATLADGRVLLVGGKDDANVGHLDAEIYDPATGTFAPTAGAPTVDCTDGTATRLLDGRVLTVCGKGSDLFDPGTGTFTQVRNNGVFRDRHVALLLPSGKVLVAGGPTATSELYDPATGQFSATGSLPGWRVAPSASVLPDGTVVLAGGWNGSPSAIMVYADVYRWSEGTGVWTAGAPLVLGRQGADMELLPSLELLVVGGWTKDFWSNAWVAVTPPKVAEIIPGPCVPAVCPVGVTCGEVPDGCGGTVHCGDCAGGLVCAAGACCAPTTCAAQGASCGTIPDGCGSTLDCGGCAAGESCSGNVCQCAPKTCADLGLTCGVASDGCGGTLTCSACPAGTTCELATGVCKTPPGQAAWDATLKVPSCAGESASCDSGTLLVGRGRLGPEPNAPNALGGCADGGSGTFHVDESLDRLKVSSLDGGPLTGGRSARIEATVWAYSSYTSDKLDLYVSPSASSPSWTLLTTLTPTRAGSQVLSTTAVLPNAPRPAIRGVFRYGGAASTCGTGSYDDRDDLVFDAKVVPDNAPPMVSITAPAAGASVAGDVTVAATATDDAGVTRVEFYVARNAAGAVPVLIGTDAAAPYSVVWNTRTAEPANSHLLSARAYDAAGNVGTTTQVVVVDNYGPTVSFTAPTDGALVGGAVALEASAVDYSGVKQVAFYADGALVATDAVAPYQATWNANGAAAGAHTLEAVAADTLGNTERATLQVMVQGSSTPGNAVYSTTYRAPMCGTATASCDSGTLLIGRASLGPETNAPNTLGASCADGTAGTFHSDESIDRVKLVSLDGATIRAGAKARLEATVWAWGTSDILDVYRSASATAPSWVLVGSVPASASGPQTLSVTFDITATGTQAVRAVFRYRGTSSPCTTGAYDDKDDLVFVAE